MHLREGGVDLGERLAKRGVEGVDGAVTLGDLVPLHAAHGQLYRGFRSHVVAGTALDCHVVGELLEGWPERPRDPVNEQIERRPGRLELPALVLQAADLGQHAVEQGTVVLHVEPTHERGDVGTARQFADENPPRIADRLGWNVLIRLGRLGDRMHVHASLVCEGARAHEWLAGPIAHVRRLIDKPRQFREVARARRARATAKHGVARQLDREVCDHRDQVGVATPLADPVDRALHLHGAGSDG